MTGHHLILGTLKDFLTGESLDDTLDERHRQKIARLLVDEKGFEKAAVEARRKLPLKAGDRAAAIRIDFLVRVADRVSMVIRYAPGSLVTRHRPTLGISRLVEPYQVPVAVATNGEDADILDGRSGALIGQGLAEIPDRERLAGIAAGNDFDPVPAARAERESRVVYCYEVDDSCPCDETICRID